MAKDENKPKYRLHLRNYRPIKYGYGKQARRYVNIKTGKEIGVGEFQKRAERIEIIPKAPKAPESIKRKRAKWFANHYNREIFMQEGHGTPDEYISYDEAMADPEFIEHEAMIHSRDDTIRDEGYAYFEELFDEYQNEDWGES